MEINKKFVLVEEYDEPEDGFDIIGIFDSVKDIDTYINKKDPNYIKTFNGYYKKSNATYFDTGNIYLKIYDCDHIKY